MCFSNVPHHFLARFCPPCCSKLFKRYTTSSYRHIFTCYKGETSDFGDGGSFPVKGTMTYKPKEAAFFMNLSWLSRGSISAALRCSRFPWSLATKGEHPAELKNFLEIVARVKQSAPLPVHTSVFVQRLLQKRQKPIILLAVQLILYSFDTRSFRTQQIGSYWSCDSVFLWQQLFWTYGHFLWCTPRCIVKPHSVGAHVGHPSDERNSYKRSSPNSFCEWSHAIKL